MLQTLFFIPNEIAGVPVFGAGLLLALWIVFSIGLMGFLLRRYGPTGETWSYVPVLLIVAVVIYVVLPYVCEPEGLPIRGYGTLLLLAIVLSLGLTIYRAHKHGLHPDVVLSLAFWTILPGIVGARLFFVIEYWDTFQHETLGQTLAAMANFAQGGIVVYGSIIGGMLGLTTYVAKNRLPWPATLDLVAPGLMLGLAIGRIGCLMNGCCFGHVCDQPWAIEFPSGSLAHVHQIEHGHVFLHGLKLQGEHEDPAIISEVEVDSPAAKAGATVGDAILSIDGVTVIDKAHAMQLLLGATSINDRVTITTRESTVPLSWAIEPPRPARVHPTQLYSAANALFLMCVLLAAERWFLRRDGQTAALLLTLYPISRFLLEIVRTDEGGQFGTTLTISQWVSIVTILGAGLFWIYTSRLKPGCAFDQYVAEMNKAEKAAAKG